MLLADYIYLTSTIIAFLSILSIFFALKNDDKKTNKTIRIYNILSIIYMAVISTLHNFIDVYVDLSIIIVWLICIIGGFLYLVSSIICLVKAKKLKDNPKMKLIRYIIYVLLILPIILFIFSYHYEFKTVLHGEFLVTLSSEGNGTLGDSKSFTYVINNNYIDEVSFEADYTDNAFIRNNYKKMTEEELNKKGVKIILTGTYNDYDLEVYKNDELLYKDWINQPVYGLKIDNIYYKTK